MKSKKSGIQIRYAYLSDLFRAIAFLIQELDSPQDLDYDDVCYIEKLLKSSSYLPKKRVVTKVPNLNGYMLFVKDFIPLFDKKNKDLIPKISELWKKADSKTKKYYKDQADTQKELLKNCLGEVQKKG